MKRVIFLFIILINTSVFSQNILSKGTYSVGGSISFTSKSGQRGIESQNEFIFNPQFGYFFFDHILASVIITYSFSKTEYEHISMWDERYGLGPSIRYYFGTDVVNPFIGISYLYCKEENDSWHDNIYSDEIKLSCGINYFVHKSLAIEGSINYSYIDREIVSNVIINYAENYRVFMVGIGVNYFVN